MTKKISGGLPLEEFNYHKEMKEKYSSYPRLPLALTDDTKRRVTSPDFKRSVIRGFKSRVLNWTEKQLPFIKEE